jgi:hypothetical protein
VAYLNIGKMVKGKEASATRAFYRCRETKSVSVSRRLARSTGTWCVLGVSGSAVPVPLTSGAGTGLKPFPVIVAQWTTLLTWSAPQKYVFQFSKLHHVCNIQNTLLCCSKIFQTLHEYILTHYEQLFFCKKAQIRNII